MNTPESPPDSTANTKRKTKTWIKVLIGAVIVAVLAVTAGPFIYIHFIKDDPPAAFSINGASSATTASTDGGSTDTSSADTSPTVASSTGATSSEATVSTDSTASSSGAATEGADGTYTITADSEVGYRVVEVLFGQDTEGVGRTHGVTGSIVVSGTQVTGDFTVDMTTIASDEDRRDSQFRGRIMNVDEFPTATFVITEPIELGAVPADGEEITATATGELTLHGVTNTVTIDVTAEKTGDTIIVVGSTDITFADYDIDNPSTGGITTQDHGLLEFRLVATST